jgi:hypothetical protein
MEELRNQIDDSHTWGNMVEAERDRYLAQLEEQKTGLSEVIYICRTQQKVLSGYNRKPNLLKKS